MRLAGREWRTLVSAVRLGRDGYRVIRPARPIAHASLHESRLGPQPSVDKAATADLAFAWWPAARSPRSLGLPHTAAEPVLLRRGVRRPEARPRAAAPQPPVPGVPVEGGPRAPVTGRERKVALPREVFRPIDREEHARCSHREFRDHLRWAIAADTLFLVGSRPAYELQREGVRELAEDCPAHLAESPDAHCCAEIELGRHRRPARNAHPPGPHFCVVAGRGSW